MTRNCSRSVLERLVAGRSGTTKWMRMALARQRPPSQKNSARQLISDSDHWIGRVAAIEPAPPAIM